MSHTCHALRCGKPCPPRMLFCRECWALVEPATQREVYRAVKLRDMPGVDASWAPWWRAQLAATLQNACARGLDETQLARYEAMQMKFVTTLEGRQAAEKKAGK